MKRPGFLALALFLLFQTLYGLLVFPVFPLVGDSADYASLIDHGVFHIRTTHVGFYVAYYPFHVLNKAFIGAGSDLFLNAVTTFFGALGVSLVFLIFMNILGGSERERRRSALYGALLFGLSGIVWYHAEFAETPALMLLGAYVSFYLFLRGRYAAAGVCLGLAALVSQAVAPCAAWFVAAAIVRRVSVGRLARFAALFLATFLLGVLLVYHDFLWGSRGLFSVHGYYSAAPLIKTLFSFAYSLLESYWPVLFLFLWAIPQIRRQRLLAWITLASLPPLVYVGRRIGHTDYGIVWLPAAFIVAAWLGIAFQSLVGRLPRRREAAVACCAMGIFLAVTLGTYIGPKRSAWIEGTECLSRVHERAREGCLIADAYVGFAYAHLFWPELAEVWDAPWAVLPDRAERIEELAADRPVYLLDYIPPSHFLRGLLLDNPLARKVLPEEKRLQFQEEFEPTSRRFHDLVPDGELELILTCGRSRLWRLAWTAPEEQPIGDPRTSE